MENTQTSPVEMRLSDLEKVSEEGKERLNEKGRRKEEEKKGNRGTKEY